MTQSAALDDALKCLLSVSPARGPPEPSLGQRPGAGRADTRCLPELPHPGFPGRLWTHTAPPPGGLGPSCQGLSSTRQHPSVGNVCRPTVGPCSLGAYTACDTLRNETGTQIGESGVCLAEGIPGAVIRRSALKESWMAGERAELRCQPCHAS